MLLIFDFWKSSGGDTKLNIMIISFLDWVHPALSKHPLLISQAMMPGSLSDEWPPEQFTRSALVFAGEELDAVDDPLPKRYSSVLVCVECLERFLRNGRVEADNLEKQPVLIQVNNTITVCIDSVEGNPQWVD